MSQNITIGKVAKASGVNIQTIRYYERIGLLKPISRRESGYRVYSEDSAKKIRFIKNAQEMGFSLSDIAVLLKLRLNPKTKCDAVKKKAKAKLKDVERKMQHLQRIKRILADLISECPSEKTIDHCPILHSMEDGLKKN